MYVIAPGLSLPSVTQGLQQGGGSTGVRQTPAGKILQSRLLWTGEYLHVMSISVAIETDIGSEFVTNHHHRMATHELTY